MSNGQQGVIHRATEGGIFGTHPAAEPVEFLVAPSISSEFNTARLRLIPVGCWSIEDIRFAFDSSFVTPDITTELRELVNLRESHKKTDLVKRTVQYPLFSVFGHADPVGTDDYNKALSGRRATVIYALLISNAEPAKAVHLWSSVARHENWGSVHRQAMLTVTGLPAGTPDAHLIQAYLRTLCPRELSLTSKDFLGQGADAGGKGDYQGCSSFNPRLVFSQKREDGFKQAERDQGKAGLAKRNGANAQNRRVMVLLFRPGSKVDPAKWPCPRTTEGTASCIKRFWSDGEKRRGTRRPDTDRKFDQVKDTFACRFYQRISVGSPCESPPPPACTLTSETVIITPTDRARVTIGVGEQVDLTYSPGSASWACTCGTLASNSGTTVRFTAPDRAATATITAMGPGCRAAITFQVIEPSGVLMEVASKTFHVHGVLSVGFLADIFIQPDSVSFCNIVCKEQECAGHGTGYLAPLSGLGHHPNPNFVDVGQQVDGKGSKVDARDKILIQVGKNALTPYRPGTFTLAIPWEFQVLGGANGAKVFATVDQVFTVDSAGTMTAKKDNSRTVSAGLNDPTSDF